MSTGDEVVAESFGGLLKNRKTAPFELKDRIATNEENRSKNTGFLDLRDLNFRLIWCCVSKLYKTVEIYYTIIDFNDGGENPRSDEVLTQR